LRDLSVRLQKAGSKRAGSPDVGQGWPVFEEYREKKADDDIHLEAVVKPVRLSRPDGTLGIMSSSNLQDAEKRSVKRYIAPITQHKDLFLKFARHIPNGRVSTEEALDVVRAWVTEYGVLGLDSVDDQLNRGRRESVRGFWRAASEAEMILDLYEAARPKKPDQRLRQVLMRWEPEHNWSGVSVNEQREYALERVGNKVGQIVENQCYPQLWRTVNKARNQTRGFTYDFGFRSLLGAMYLQMMWLLTDEDNVRQCQRRGCYNTLPPGSNKNRMYCSDACKQWEWDNKES
jgi:hypothetical protein